jgi:drug/metabolite transporter (DMT)-like permease
MNTFQNLIVKNIKWLMLIPGIVTCSMIYNTIDPQAGLMQTFGAGIEHPLADVVVRSWGFLIALVGALMMYGAYQPQSRHLILVIAIVSKLAFILLNLIYGQAYIGTSIVAIVFDSILIILYSTYLLQNRHVD